MNRFNLATPERNQICSFFICRPLVTYSCILILMFSVMPSIALCQPDSDELTDEWRGAIIDSVSIAIRNNYVIPNIAEDMSEAIRDKLRNGEYNDFISLKDFISQLTIDLRGVSNDKHIKLQLLQGNNEESTAVDSAEVLRQQMEKWRKANFGFHQIKRLDGNIGYIDLWGFYDVKYAAPTAIAGLNFLANSDALIFDLRQNTGGNGNMVTLLCSYFFSEPKLLSNFCNREGEIEKQDWTEGFVSGPRFIDIPVYILVSKTTFSAAEGFAYAMKHLDRAKIVGERTGGGAHPMQSYDFPGISVSVNIPYLRAVSPITKTNWEGVGVEPDISASSDDALEIAQIEILKYLMVNTESDEEKHAFSMIMDEVKAKLNPVNLSEEELMIYTGGYGQQGMQVKIKNGRLNVMGYILVPMGNDKFMITNGEQQVQFTRSNTGDISEMVVQFRDGNEIPFKRLGD